MPDKYSDMIDRAKTSDIDKINGAIGKMKGTTGSRIVDIKEAGRSKEIRTMSRSMIKVLGKMEETVEAMAKGAKTISYDTAQIARKSLSQYSQAISGEISIDKQKFVTMALSRTSPLFGYFASKFMETSVFKDATEKIKSRMTDAMSGVADKFKGVMSREVDRTKGFIDEAGHKINELKAERRALKSTPRKVIQGESKAEEKRYIDSTIDKKMKKAQKSIPKMQKGGVLEKDKTIRAHAGEAIVPVSKLFNQMDKSRKETTSSVKDFMKGLFSFQTKQNLAIMDEVSKERKGFFKGFADTMKNVHVDYERSTTDVTRAILDMRNAMTGMTGKWTLLWQRMLIQNPVMRFIYYGVKDFMAVVSSPFKMLFKARSKYGSEVPRSANVFQNIAGTLGLIYDVHAQKFDVLIQRQEDTIGAIKDSSQMISGGVADEMEPVQKTTYTVAGKMLRGIAAPIEFAIGKTLPEEMSKTLNKQRELTLASVGATLGKGLVGTGKGLFRGAVGLTTKATEFAGKKKLIAGSDVEALTKERRVGEFLPKRVQDAIEKRREKKDLEKRKAEAVRPKTSLEQLQIIANKASESVNQTSYQVAGTQLTVEKLDQILEQLKMEYQAVGPSHQLSELVNLIMEMRGRAEESSIERKKAVGEEERALKKKQTAAEKASKKWGMGESITEFRKEEKAPLGFKVVPKTEKYDPKWSEKDVKSEEEIFAEHAATIKKKVPLKEKAYRAAKKRWEGTGVWKGAGALRRGAKKVGTLGGMVYRTPEQAREAGVGAAERLKGRIKGGIQTGVRKELEILNKIQLTLKSGFKTSQGILSKSKDFLSNVYRDTKKGLIWEKIKTKLMTKQLKKTGFLGEKMSAFGNRLKKMGKGIWKWILVGWSLIKGFFGTFFGPIFKALPVQIAAAMAAVWQGTKWAGKGIGKGIGKLGTMGWTGFKGLTTAGKIGLGGGLVGGAMMAKDLYGGVKRADEWAGGKATGGQKVTAGLTGALMGTSKGAAGAAQGALKGAGVGAAIGSIIPGVGTAIGAAVGGIAGAIGGWVGGERGFKAVMGAKKAIVKMAKVAWSVVTYPFKMIKKSFLWMKEQLTWKSIKEKVTGVASAAWKGIMLISSIPRRIIGWILEKISKVPLIGKLIPKKVINSLTGAVEMKPSAIGTAGAAATGALTKGKEFVESSKGNIKDYVESGKEKISDISEQGKDIMERIKEKGKKGLPALVAFAKDRTMSTRDKIKFITNSDNFKSLSKKSKEKILYLIDKYKPKSEKLLDKFKKQSKNIGNKTLTATIGMVNAMDKKLSKFDVESTLEDIKEDTEDFFKKYRKKGIKGINKYLNIAKDTSISTADKMRIFSADPEFKALPRKVRKKIMGIVEKLKPATDVGIEKLKEGAKKVGVATSGLLGKFIKKAKETNIKTGLQERIDYNEYLFSRHRKKIEKKYIDIAKNKYLSVRERIQSLKIDKGFADLPKKAQERIFNMIEKSEPMVPTAGAITGTFGKTKEKSSDVYKDTLKFLKQPNLPDIGSKTRRKVIKSAKELRDIMGWGKTKDKDQQPISPTAIGPKEEKEHRSWGDKLKGGALWIHKVKTKQMQIMFDIQKSAGKKLWGWAQRMSKAFKESEDWAAVRRNNQLEHEKDKLKKQKKHRKIKNHIQE